MMPQMNPLVMYAIQAFNSLVIGFFFGLGFKLAGKLFK